MTRMEYVRIMLERNGLDQNEIKAAVGIAVKNSPTIVWDTPAKIGFMAAWEAARSAAWNMLPEDDRRRQLFQEIPF